MHSLETRSGKKKDFKENYLNVKLLPAKLDERTSFLVYMQHQMFKMSPIFNINVTNLPLQFMVMLSVQIQKRNLISQRLRRFLYLEAISLCSC